MTESSPTVTFFVSGGTVPLGAPSYVPREADRALLEALGSGRYAYVLTSRQMGKSSLSVRTMEALRDRGVRSAFVDLTRVGGRNVTAEQWYAGLLSEVGRGLGDRAALLAHWKAHAELGPMQRFFGALRDIVADSDQAIVVFIDEIDTIRSLAFSTDEFFAGIRECYNRRVEDPAMARLTFCLIGVAIPTDLMSDVKLTPFNVGERIVLRDFSVGEMATLASGLGSSGPTLVARIHHWTGGHPFLTQSVGRRLAEEHAEMIADVDRIVAEEFFGARAKETNINLADVGNRVLNSYDDPNAIARYRSDILSLYESVLKGRRVPDDESNRLVAVLKLSGLVAAANGRLKVRNRVYERVYGSAWIEEHMPDQEMRRQRRAFRHGMVRVGMGAAAMLAVMGFLAVSATGNAQRANDALAQAKRERDRANDLARQAGTERDRANLNADRAQKAKAAANVATAKAQKLAAAQTRALTDRETALKKAREEKSRADAQTLLALDQTRLANLGRAEADRQRRSAIASAERAVQAGQIASRQTKLARTQTRIAQTSAQEASQQSYEAYVSTVALASGSLKAGQPALAANLLRPLQGSRWARFEYDFLSGAANVVQNLTFKRSSPVGTIGYTPDGAWIVACENDGVAVVTDARSGEKIREFPVTAKGVAPRSLATLPGGRMVLGDQNGQLSLYDLGTGARLWQVATGMKYVNLVSVSPDGQRIAAGGDGAWGLWNVRDGSLLRHDPWTGGAVASIRFSPKGDRVAMGGDGGLAIVDPDSGKSLKIEMTDQPQDVAWSPDGAIVGVAGNSHEQGKAAGPWFYNARTGELRAGFAQSPSYAVQATPDGQSWIIGYASGQIDRLAADLKNAASVGKVDAGSVNLSLQPRGEAVVASGASGDVRVFELRAPNGPQGGRLLRSGDDVWAIDASEKARIAVMARRRPYPTDEAPDRLGTQLELVDLDTGAPRWQLDYPSIGAPFMVALSPDGSRVAFTGVNGLIRFLSIKDGRDLGSVDGNFVARFSPDGRLLATTLGDDIALYDARALRVVRTLPHQRRTIGCAFSPDGRCLATGSDDGAVRVWDLTQKVPPRVFAGHSAEIYGVAYSSDGRRIVSSGVDGNRVWDVATGRQTLTLKVPGAQGEIAAFTPDGTRIITQMTGNSAAATRVWDARTGRELVALGDAPAGRTLAILSDRAILTGNSDGTLREFDGLSEAQHRLVLARGREAEALALRQKEDEARRIQQLAGQRDRAAQNRNALKALDAALARRDFKEAARIEGELLRGAPEDSQVRRTRANHLAFVRDYAEAEREIRILLREPRSYLTYFDKINLALYVLLQGRPKEYDALADEIMGEYTVAQLLDINEFALIDLNLRPVAYSRASRDILEAAIAEMARQHPDHWRMNLATAAYLLRTGRVQEAYGRVLQVQDEVVDPAFQSTASAIQAICEARLGDADGYAKSIARMRRDLAVVSPSVRATTDPRFWDQTTVGDLYAAEAERTPVDGSALSDPRSELETSLATARREGKPVIYALLGDKAGEAALLSRLLGDGEAGAVLRRRFTLVARVDRAGPRGGRPSEVLTSLLGGKPTAGTLIVLNGEAQRVSGTDGIGIAAVADDPNARASFVQSLRRANPNLTEEEAGSIEKAAASVRGTEAATKTSRARKRAAQGQSIGRELMSKRRFAEAIRIFEATFDPETFPYLEAWTLSDHASSLWEVGRRDEALLFFRRAWQMDSSAYPISEHMMILDQLLFVRGAPSEDLRSRMERLMAKTLPDIVPAWMWERAKVLILLRSGAYTQALKELDAIDTNEAPIQWRAFYTAMRTILLSRLGRIEDARAIMPRLRSETAELDRAPAETGTGYDLVRIHAIVAEAMAEPGLVQTQARVAPSVALGSLVPSFGLAFSLRRRPFL